MYSTSSMNTTEICCIWMYYWPILPLFPRLLHWHWSNDTQCPCGNLKNHYNDVIMSAMASQITGVLIVYSIVCSDVDQRKHQNFASNAFVRGIHRWPVNSPHKGASNAEMFPLNDVIMIRVNGSNEITRNMPWPQTNKIHPGHHVLISWDILYV